MNLNRTLNRLRSSTFPLARPTTFHTGALSALSLSIKALSSFHGSVGSGSGVATLRHKCLLSGALLSEEPLIPQSTLALNHFRGWPNRLTPTLTATELQRASPRGIPGRACSSGAVSTQTTRMVDPQRSFRSNTSRATPQQRATPARQVEVTLRISVELEPEGTGQAASLPIRWGL